MTSYRETAMDRRELLGTLAVAVPALSGLSPDRLLAVGRQTHGRTDVRTHSVFDEHQHATVDQISELIMPATDTPGARAAGVVGFIEVIVAEYYRDDERAAFVSGLADIDARCQALFGKTFVDCAEPQQTAVLTGMDAESRAMPRGGPQHIFARLKGLTLYGYYTSEIGYKQELLQTFMPGRYDGAAPLPRAAAGGR
jgi:hypothetical protein